MINEKFRYYYVGNCINCFDEDGDCICDELPFSTVSDFAVANEDTISLSEEAFYKLAYTDDFSFGDKDDECEYFRFFDYPDVIVAYNKDTDVHYFFVE